MIIIKNEILNYDYLLKTISNLGIRYDIWKVFYDFLIISVYTISNSINFNEDREQEYLKIINKYEKQEQELFIKMLVSLVNSLDENEFNDVLGKIYEELNLFNKYKGQFFTPPHICDFMVKGTLNDDVERQIKNKGYIIVSDPACGSGRLLYSYLKELHSKNINYPKNVYVEAQDISELCCYMTYIQLSLYGVNGKVILGNTLTNEKQDIFYTPMYLLFPIKKN